MNTLSFIIPVYNAENYINKCIDSLLMQTYKNIEIIIVDDGSTDRSFEICTKYQERDSRIKVFRQKNRGVSEARNYGIRQSGGTYIAFVDADDYISHTFAQDMLEEALRHPNSIGICDAFIKLGLEKQYSSTELFVNNWTVWGKIFPKNLIKDISFDPTLNIGEDLSFLTDIFWTHTNIKTFHLKKALYVQCINSQSAMHLKKYDIRILNAVNIEIECYKKLVNKNVNISDSLLIFNGIYQFLTRFWQQTILEIKKNYSDYQYVKNVSRQYQNIIRRGFEKNRKKGLAIYILLKAPFFYYPIKKLKEKI